MPSVCDFSLVNGLGYSISDSSITASTTFHGEYCDSHNARYMGSPENIGWCSGMYEI